MKTFSVTNFKGVREITLSPTGALVVVAGSNGAGKSSFIDAFVELFDPKGTRLTPKPIHEGADEARAEFSDTDLGIRVVRTWRKNDAGKLEVFALDGAKYSKPADMVAELTGGLIFDPVAFLNLDERKQRDALLAKVDLPFDLDALARKKARAEQRRLEAGREVKRLQGALASMPNPSDAPDEEVSAAVILEEIEALQAENSRLDRAENIAVDLHRQLSAADQLITRLEADLAKAREDRASIAERWDAASRMSSAQRHDLGPLQARLAAADEINAKVRAKRERQKIAEQREAAELSWATYDTELESIDAVKREGLAAAQFPVDGLSVTDDGVTFDGIPFSQVNSAARRKVAFAIATAGEPKLRLVIIRDGDLLDSDSLAGIRELAEERGYTVLVERDRDESRQIGFTVVDGALADG